MSMIGGVATNLGTGATGYFGIYSGSFTSFASTTNETSTVMAIPFNCDVSNFYVNLDTQPGGALSGKSYTFIIRQNQNDTPINVTISNANVTNSDTTNSASFSSGDIFSISSTPANNPNQSNVRWSCRLTSI